MENCNPTREEKRSKGLSSGTSPAAFLGSDPRAALGRPTFSGVRLPMETLGDDPAVPELPVNVAFGLLNNEVESLGKDIRCLRDRLLSSVLRGRPEYDGEKCCEDPSAKPAPDPIRSPVANGLYTVIRGVNDVRSDVIEILDRLEA